MAEECHRYAAEPTSANATKEEEDTVHTATPGAAIRPYRVSLRTPSHTAASHLCGDTPADPRLLWVRRDRKTLRRI